MSYSIFDGTMAAMTWPDLEKALKENAAVLLPTSVIEEHGPHMCLGVDAYLGFQLCRLVKAHLEMKGIATLIVPPCYWGINSVTGAFPGSYSLRDETMKALIYDIISCLAQWGAAHVFNVNWHDDARHCSVLLDAIRQVHNNTGIKASAVISEILAMRLGLTGQEEHILVYRLPVKEGEKPQSQDIHAGFIETSAMAAFFSNEVNFEKAKRLTAVQLNSEEFALWRKGGEYVRRLTPQGYLGSPAGFSPEVGRKIMHELSAAAAEKIEEALLIT